MQLRNIQSSHPSPRHSCTASPWLLHNVQLWSTAVCWETSAPLLLQNPLITWFCLRIAAFNIPAMWTKEKKNKTRGTHKLCPNDTRKYSHRKCIRHQLCPKPTVACAACKPGWMSLLLCHITNYGSGTESSRYLIASHFPHIVCVEAVTAVYPNSIWNVCGNRTGKHRLLLIFSREVDAKSCVRQQVW